MNTDDINYWKRLVRKYIAVEVYHEIFYPGRTTVDEALMFQIINAIIHQPPKSLKISKNCKRCQFFENARRDIKYLEERINDKKYVEQLNQDLRENGEPNPDVDSDDDF